MYSSDFIEEKEVETEKQVLYWRFHNALGVRGHCVSVLLYVCPDVIEHVLLHPL
jgi:hypothetical protein